jgi:superfamily II DNA/RNA helicase
MKFTDLGLNDELLRAVHEAGYEEPTPIQAQAIPVVLMGRDVLGCAQTGTGKTASFTLPMMEILASGRAKSRMPRSLILEPTRELAAQVADNFDTYGKYQKLTKALLIGGSSMEEQLKVLNRGADVLIATPGRLLDVFERGHLLMTDVKVLVIDEADRMLDMGFIPDVEKIVSLLSPMRTTLLFSATMPKEIKRLADKFLTNPKEITVSKPASTADTITQALIKLRAPSKAPDAAQKVKRDRLRSLIAEQEEISNALVFCNLKRDVDVVYRSLEKHGLSAARLHGDMVQSVRMDTLEKFKKNEVTILVCSDVAARGLDISTVSHVFNFDIPTHAEDYVHRIGRTGRAGRSGRAFTFVMPEDRKYLEQIEKLIGKPIPLLGEAVEAPAKTDDAKVENAKPDNAKADADTSNTLAEAKGTDDKDASDRPKRSRSRGGRGRKKAETTTEDNANTINDTQADAQPVEKKAKQKPERKSVPKSERKPSPKPKNNDNDDIGASPWGDNMPAFLSRSVELPKS